jgi:hypothetical protein
MGMLQQDTGVGTVVGTDSGEGSIRGHLDPRDSEAGAALAIAVAAFVILLVTIGRDAKGFGRILVVGQFVLIVIAASAVGQYAARTWALRHPDNRIAAGVSVAI